MKDRALLAGPVIVGMPQQCATATIARMVDASNKVALTIVRTTLLQVANG